jgi:hypothetical protein
VLLRLDGLGLTRQTVLLSLVAVLCLLVVRPAVASAAVGWGAGTEASLPTGAASNPQAILNSVSCSAAGSCSAVGFYFGQDGDRQGLLSTESGGLWTPGTEVTPPGDADANPLVDVDAVSCASAGNCTAVGTYTDSSGHAQGLLLTESGGVWSAGTRAALPSGAASNPAAALDAVSCASPGNCTAVGSYRDSAGYQQGLLLTESGVTSWTSQEAPVPAGVAANPDVVLNSVSCGSAADCTAVGSYTDGTEGQGLLLTQSGSSWSTAEASLPTGGTAATVSSVSCAAAGECTAVGSYTAGSNTQGLLLTQSSGSWGTGAEASLPSGATGANLASVSCVSSGECAAVGVYTDSAGNGQGLLLSKAGGTWGTGEEAGLPAGASSSNQDADADSVSCSSAGNCSAVGTYFDDADQQQGFLLTEAGGSWSAAAQLTIVSGASSNPDVSLDSVSCAAAGNCGAGGTYIDSANKFQGLLVREAANPALTVSAPSGDVAGTAIPASSLSSGLSSGATPSGQVTFTVFGPQSSAPTVCGGAGTPVASVAVTGDGTYGPSSGFTPSSGGDYWWYASYDGDASDNSVGSTCGSGMVETVVTAPSNGGGAGNTGGGSGSGGSGSGSGSGGGSGSGAGGGSGSSGGSGSGAGTTLGTPSNPNPLSAAGLGVGRVTLSGATATVALTCHGASGQSCAVHLALSVIETIKGGKVTEVAALATKGATAKRKTVSLGSCGVTLAAGQSRAVLVSLNGAGKALLAKRHTLHAGLTVGLPGTLVLGRTLTFTQKKAKKKR